jgi:2-alkenal reductase
VIVVQVAPGSPAERAGIQGVNKTTGAVGDIIVGVDGKQVRRLADLTDELEPLGVGKTAKLTLDRRGDKRSVSLQIADVGETQ